MKSSKRRPGAPLGNQNARKHGLYSKRGVRGGDISLMSDGDLDNDIALLRYRIFAAIRTDPAAPLLAYYALLRRMLRQQGIAASRRHEESRAAAERLGQALAITTVIDEAEK